MKVASYCRVSTREQKLDSQRESIKQFCKQNKHKLFDEYLDEGISGVTSDRPALKRLFKDAEDKKFDAVVVFKLDRFGRSAADLYKNTESLKALNINFMSVSDKIDTSSIQGKLLFGVLASFAEFERNTILDRTKIGLERARKLGTRSGLPMHRPKKHIPKKELKDLYVDKKFSIASCAKFFHVSRVTLVSRLKEYGLYVKKQN